MLARTMTKTEKQIIKHRSGLAWNVLLLLPVAVVGALMSADSHYDFTDASFVASCFRSGTLPTWHPGLNLGRPFAALTAACPWYPLHWLWIPFDPARVAPVLLALHLWIAGLGAWRFASPRKSAWLLALSCQVVLLASALWGSPDSVQPATWLPWIVVSLRQVSARKRGSELRAATACALALLAGSLSVGLFVVASGCLLALHSSKQRRASLVVAALFGLLLGGVRLLPSLEAAGLEFHDLATETARAERSRGLPLAFVDAKDSSRAGELTLFRPAPHRVDVQVASSSGGRLVFREPWAPDWKCNVNGEDVAVEVAEHGFRQVRIPTGDSLVRTWYEPWSLRFGTTLTLLTWIYLMRRRTREAA